MKRKTFERVLPLNSDLEKAVLYAMMHGQMEASSVNKDELSKIGRVIYTAIRSLVKDRGKSVHPKTVYLTATEVHNADSAEIKSFLKDIEAGEIPEIQSIHSALTRKRVITSLVNEATDQVASGDYSILALRSLIEASTHSRNTLTPLSKEMGDDVGPPEGIPIPCLSTVTEATGGLFGVWLLGGEPAAGKSTLALQISLSVGRRRPVLYYDFEQGKSVIRYHVKKALGGDKAKIEEATHQLYIRHSLGSLEYDLNMIDKPSLVVVDSIQKVASSVTFRRESLESWVHKLEALKKYGHHVIMVSEKKRGSYGAPSLEGYKETGELEYAADAAFDMIKPDEEDSSIVDLFITKNRHYAKRGFVTQLKRENSWWFAENKLARREID